MTTLRNDGLLEIDDPVVAACFIGRGYSLPDDLVSKHHTLGKIYAVRHHGVEQQNRARNDYPILIPASVVAAVIDWPNLIENKRYCNVVAEAIHEGKGITERFMLWKWLHTHTQEDPMTHAEWMHNRQILWASQDGHCPVCGVAMDPGERMELAHRVPDTKPNRKKYGAALDHPDNLALVDVRQGKRCNDAVILGAARPVEREALMARIAEEARDHE